MSDPSSSLKPAPLSFGRSDSSARFSPFRRPQSPLDRSPSTVRAATPTNSPLKQATLSTFARPSPSPSPSPSPTKEHTPVVVEDRSWISSKAVSSTLTPKMDGNNTPESPTKSPRMPLGVSTSSMASRFESPGNTSTSNASTTRPSYARTNTERTVRPALNRGQSSDPLSAVPPHHLHTMRESFAVLDRSNSGTITTKDLTHQLNELGMDASSNVLSQHFPPGTSSLNLASYLSLLSSDLTRLSSQTELLDALSTFDTEDSGQIDVQELMEALVSTVPEEGERRMTAREVDMCFDGFTGRRVFRKGAASNTGGLGTNDKRPVFRYGEFVNGIWGGQAGVEKAESVA